MPAFPSGMNREQWETRLAALGLELAKRGQHARLVVFGSVPNVMRGQSARTTIDLDVWRVKSDFDTESLKAASEAAGMEFDPKGTLEPDKPYIQIVDQGIVNLGEFKAEELARYGGLRLDKAPDNNVVASKLARATAQDLEDIQWIVSQKTVEIEEIKKIIDTFPSIQRKTAQENLVYLQISANKEAP